MWYFREESVNPLFIHCISAHYLVFLTSSLLQSVDLNIQIPNRPIKTRSTTQFLGWKLKGAKWSTARRNKRRKHEADDQRMNAKSLKPEPVSSIVHHYKTDRINKIHCSTNKIESLIWVRDHNMRFPVSAETCNFLHEHNVQSSPSWHKELAGFLGFFPTHSFLLW